VRLAAAAAGGAGGGGDQVAADGGRAGQGVARSSAGQDAQRHRGDFAGVAWVACAMFRVATEMAYLQIGTRRVTVPWHGYVIVAWQAPPVAELPARPPIAAIGEDGSRLTGLGQNDHLDGLTWAAVGTAIKDG